MHLYCPRWQQQRHKPTIHLIYKSVRGFMSTSSFVGRRCQTGGDTSRGAMSTGAGRGTTHTMETITLPPWTEVATRSPDTWTTEALLVTGGPNKTGRGTWQLPLTGSQLLTETTATAVKDPPHCKGPDALCKQRPALAVVSFHTNWRAHRAGLCNVPICIICEMRCFAEEDLIVTHWKQTVLFA